MGRFNYQEVDRYGGQGGGGYFSLKNDRDVARVRFMYNSIDDVTGYAVHQVEVDGRKRYVNCLRNYNDPIDKCPFCKAHHFQMAKLFIPIYNVDADKVQIWDRGKKFFGDISSIVARYPNVVSQEFEIERHGRAGDTSTTYGIFPVGSMDNTTLEDLPPLPNIIGGVVLDKTEEELEYYLEHGEFPKEDAPVRRRGEEPRESRNESYGRRTPAGGGRREAF